jgi:hypothetical protein
VTAEEWALAASSFFSGLAAGFLGGLCTILRPMQAAMTGPEFRNFMERFLRYADIGLGVWVVGVLVVSNVWKTPTYKMILAGDPEAMPADWEATRQRYFTINSRPPGRRSPSSWWP